MAKHAKTTTPIMHCITKGAIIGAFVTTALLGASGTAAAATGEPSSGPNYGNVVGEWGKSRQAGLSKAQPIVRASIEMNGNKAPLGTVGCGSIGDGDAGANQISHSIVIKC